MGNRVTIKGQVTIPKRVRERLDIRPGDEVEFREHNGSFVLTKRDPRPALKRYVGQLGHLAGRRSDDVVREMRGD
jgi:AbrB family looped-hinge helix DNA binding protein